MDRSQIIETIDTGVVIFDNNFMVSSWNGWMTAHSRIGPDEIIGRSLFDFYPNLKKRSFLRNCKSVLAFGNLAFFPQDPYAYLFAMKPLEWFRTQFEFMQQSCTIGPIRDADNQITHLFVSVRDLTEEAAYKQELLKLSQRDPLTGSYNRRYLNAFLEDELYRCERYNRPMSVIMMDIDYFKEINDQYGHPFGDKVLQAIASTIHDRMRKSNRFARYGGEEFCIVLPETDAGGAMVFSEKIRGSIEALTLYVDETPVKFTASFGVSTYTDEIKDVATIIKKSDEALYKAKQAGRNRTVAV